MADRDPVLIHAGNARTAARRYHVRFEDIMGILSVEGGTSADGKPVAPEDGAGPPSYGQFTFETGRSLGIKYGDSASEVDGIARYLRQLGYADDRERAIAAYNGGPGNPQYDYARKVDAAAKRYAGGGADVGGTVAAGTSDGDTSSPATGDTSSTGLFGANVRSGAVRALVFVLIVAAAIALAIIGVTRASGARTA